MELETHDACEICAGNNWGTVYRGPVRDGAFGKYSQNEALVAQCGRCGAQRLDEASCKQEEIYKSEEYRCLLNQATDSEAFFAEHDKLQIRNLNALQPYSLRDKIVADIGCAAGSFLDHVRGLAREAIAVEPCRAYHKSLSQRGYKVYPFVQDVLAEQRGTVDIAFCFSVLEHIVNPLIFLEEISQLLKHNGLLLISTPNRSDILMDLLPGPYSSFYYRTVHRWYFDVDSLRYCLQKAGYNVLEEKCIHRFGLSNAMAWLRDKKPTGEEVFPQIDAMLDNIWKNYLEERKIGDYLYFMAGNKDRLS